MRSRTAASTSRNQRRADTLSSKKPVLLLTGRPGVGKTTVMRRVLADLADLAGGFFTREIRRDGVRRGFEIVTTAGRSAWLATKDRPSGFSDSTPFKSFEVNLAAVREVAVPAIRQARQDCKIVVIDEIGPMENKCEEFRDAVEKMMDDEETTILGTIAELGDEFSVYIRAHPRVVLIRVTPENRDGLPVRIRTKLQRIFNCRS